MRRLTTILLTGFGPFPGMPENASALLVPKLAHLVARRFHGHRVVARILPTEWEAGPARLAAHYLREKPGLALHFGVSERAKGFVIETLARNARRFAADAAGASPPSPCILKDGPATLKARLPADDIVARLDALGIPACLSGDAGDYLCNSILYHALMLAEKRPAPTAVGFIHIPSSLVPRNERTTARSSKCALDWESALLGGLEIVRVCLGRPPSTRVKAR